MKLKTIIFAVVLSCLHIATYATEPDDFPEFEMEVEQESTQEFPEDEGFEVQGMGEELGFDSELELDLGEVDSSESEKPSFWSELSKASRFTLKHEWSHKTEEPEGTINSRSSIRLEFSKFFGNYFFLQFDTKLNVFWGNDHRAEAEDEDPYLETNTKEAFLQASFGDTSIKAGLQILIWGESDGGAIADVISPRDYSELFFISLEESRIGQPMLIIDQFSGIGDWSVFYIPEAEFNKYPEEGTEYYYDPFAGQAKFEEEETDEALHEYGLRWKKTFGKSDIALMAASLIDNDYAYRWDGYTANGKMLITKTKQRFSMVGMTFNFASGNFLYKGEIGRKSPRSFNDASYQIIQKDVSDVALGLEYSPGGRYTIGAEAVNSHIHDWEEDIQGVKENTSSLVFTWSKTFLNEDLSVNWMSSYIQPYVAYFHSLRTSYKWNDSITFEFEAFAPNIRDEDNAYYIYKDQKQLVFKAQLQF